MTVDFDSWYGVSWRSTTSAGIFATRIHGAVCICKVFGGVHVNVVEEHVKGGV